MIGQISASNQLRTSSELAPNMFEASSELASVMEFGFKDFQRGRASEAAEMRGKAVAVRYARQGNKCSRLLVK